MRGLAPERRLDTAPDRCTVLLIAMPWQDLGVGSIQTGVLKPVLERAGFSTKTKSFYLAFMEYLSVQTQELAEEEKIQISDYEDIAARRFWDVGMGDWIFAVPPFRDLDPESDREYFAYLRRQKVPEEAVRKAIQMRRLVPGFARQCVAEVLAHQPRVVGFTSSFSQNVASLLVSRMLKQCAPSLLVIFGGANCDGTMGAALHRTFPWIDVVVRGEGESVLPELLQDLFQGGQVRPQPGLCYRQGGEQVVVDQASGGRPPIENVAAPDYDEYFQRLEGSRLRDRILPQSRLLFESSRGCWWGEKAHCTFCGLNGTSMAFRVKKADRVLEEIQSLSARYKRLEFEAVDNIIDMTFFHSLIPHLRSLRRSGFDFTFFYETKANLAKNHVQLLRDAGIRRIQPGIESLSTPILQLMNKGVTGLQNIRLLKWASLYGVLPTWNLLYGFPGEPPEEYERMALLMPSLTHLRPPSVKPLRVHRFSPYHMRCGDFGLQLLGPSDYYRFIYPVSQAALTELAYEFNHTYIDGQQPESYVQAAKEAAEMWDMANSAGSCLFYQCGPGFIKILDQRINLPRKVYSFGEVEARIYLACAHGASPATVWRSLPERMRAVVSVDEIRSFLDELVTARLIYEEDGRYLSLALPSNVDAEETSGAFP